jgi:preprotein translocase subunit SecE
MATTEPPTEAARGSLPMPKSRRGAGAFFTEVRREMKKVSWPTRPETNRLTGVVLAVCVMGVIALTAMSLSFEAVVNLITKGSLR